MRHKRTKRLAVCAVFLALFTVGLIPASAHEITSASVSGTCSSYTISVAGDNATFVGVNYSVNYIITLSVYHQRFDSGFARCQWKLQCVGDETGRTLERRLLRVGLCHVSRRQRRYVQHYSDLFCKPNLYLSVANSAWLSCTNVEQLELQWHPHQRRGLHLVQR